MDKQDIVVGGIYEFAGGFDMKNITYHSCRVEKAFPDGWNQFVLISEICDTYTAGTAYTFPIGRQIGYDATYSEPYQRTKAEYDEIEGLITSCAQLIKFYAGISVAVFEKRLAMLNEMQRELNNDKIMLNSELAQIKATSWMKEDSYE